MAVPVLASLTTATNEATGNTYTIAKPTGVASGDVLYVLAASDSTSDTINTPTGFAYENDISGSGCRIYLFSRRADGTEGATLDIYHPTANRYKASAYYRVTGVDAAVSDLTHQYAELDDTGTGTSHSSPAITTTAADCLVMSAFLTDLAAGADSMAAASGETEVFDVQLLGFNTMVMAGYRTDAAATGTYDHDVTFSPSGAACLSLTWAVNAAAGGGSTARYGMLLGVG